MNLGICVGHSRGGDKGAVSLWGESEWDYNSKVAIELKAELDRRGKDSFIIDDYSADGSGCGYSAGIRRAAKLLRDQGATHCIELHFNAATPSAHGAEWLHWHNSTGGKRLAESIQAGFTQTFPTIRDRGIKPRHAGQRGSLFLRLTPVPAVICEPFFGSNEGDCAEFEGKEADLALAYAEGISRL